MNIIGMPVSPDVLALNPQLRGTVDSATKTPSKYHNARTEAKGLRFQSGHEAAGVTHLVTLDEVHQRVFGLRLQVRFPLPGETVYVADAVYAELREGKLTLVIKDFKGFQTPEFRLKRKLFRERYGMDIELG